MLAGSQVPKSWHSSAGAHSSGPPVQAPLRQVPGVVHGLLPEPAAIVQPNPEDGPEVTIQRIERGNPHAVAFTDEEIALAAKIGAEVR